MPKSICFFVLGSSSYTTIKGSVLLVTSILDISISISIDSSIGISTDIGIAIDIDIVIDNVMSMLLVLGIGISSCIISIRWITLEALYN